MSKDPHEMTADQLEERIVQLAFDGDHLRFREFAAKLKAGLPEGTGVALRGSVITNERYENGGPFDEKGRGTSDLDVTLVGDEVMKFWRDDGFYIPALHTKPLSDKDPQIAAAINPLREELQRMAGRPVNFQATANLILFARDMLFDEAYFTLFEAAKEA
jgi:hypothetical protein